MINQKLIDEVLRVLQLCEYQETIYKDVYGMTMVHTVVDKEKLEAELAILLEDYKIDKL